MNIQICLILCLVLTMLTGTIAYLFFVIIKKITAKLLIIKTHYILLKVVILCFLIPFCFCYEMIRYLSVRWWTGYFLLSTKMLVVAANIILVVWIAGMVLNIVRVVKDYSHVKMTLSIYERYSDYDEYLTNTKQKLNVFGNVQVYRGIFYDSPMASGIFKKEIYIPEREYSEEQLQYIFLHELLHHKHKDILMMFLTNILYIVYWFHPLLGSKFIQKQYCELMEDACDIDVCRISGNSKAYIKVLARLVLDAYESYDEVGAFLVEQKGDVMRRIKNMGLYQAQRNVKRIFVILLSIVLFSGSMLVVSATESGVIAGYNKTYKSLWAGTNESVDEYEKNTLREYYEEAPISNGLSVEYSFLEASDLVNINCLISANSEKRSCLYELKKGDLVSVAIGIESNDKTVKIGLTKIDGSVQYVSEFGQIYHTFTISENGSYSIFIQNDNDEEVEVIGYYKIL